jgi:hypothetical protein
MLTLKRPEYCWPFLWGGLALALVVVVVLEYQFGGVEVGTGPRAPAKVAEAKLLPPFTLPPEAQAAPETVAKPLFVPSRRPSPPAVLSTAPAMRKGQFVLTGVTVAPEVTFVFLKEVATGKTQSVKKGAMVNGIVVDAVEPRRVVLRQGEETEDLSLTIQVPPRVAAAPAATGAVPPAPGAVPPAPGSAPPTPGGPVLPPGGTVPHPDGTAVPQSPMPAATTARAASGQAATPGAAPAMPASDGYVRRRPWINAQ